MELWIRSQDREQLLKVNWIEIFNDTLETDDEFTFTIICNRNSFGSFKTKKRALEVLDEIQKLLMPKMIYHTNNVEFIPDYQATTGGKFVSKNDDSKMEYMNMPIVYSMPKE